MNRLDTGNCDIINKLKENKLCLTTTEKQHTKN